jgi:ketosteroid isomerase-like protein
MAQERSSSCASHSGRGRGRAARSISGSHSAFLFGAVSARLLSRLPPGSRVRQAVLWRVTRLSVEAYNRRDLDDVVAAYHPDLEYYPYREFVEAGLAEPCYYGPSGYQAYISATYDVWGTDVLLEPTELIDLGDRVVFFADPPLRAQASGTPLAQTYAGVSTLKDGRVIRQDDFLNHAEALGACRRPRTAAGSG